jgi:hypothetical protein
MKLRNININGDLDKLKDAQNNLNYIVAKVQQTCDHTLLAEDDGAPSYRICLACGMTEIGWGCGFIKLVNTNKDLGIPSISRNKIIELRQGLVLDADKKSKLLRSETTIKELVKEWHDGQ